MLNVINQISRHLFAKINVKQHKHMGEERTFKLSSHMLMISKDGLSE
jgi:hypothetical protein